MAQVSVARRTTTRPIGEWAIDRVWRFFCSVRIAIYEIILLAVLVLVGTLRGSSVPRSLADAVPIATPLVDAWYAWDVYQSLLFMALMTLLAVGVAIGGIVNRIPGIWAAIAHPTVTTTHGFIRNAEASASAATALPPAALAAALAASLRAARYRVLVAERGEAVHVYADRWRFGKLGTFPFHVALILILVAGIVGARWGFRETEFFVPEGSTREVGHETGLSVRLDDWGERYRENGVPGEYRSDVTILRDGRPIQTAAITVNNPLTLGDTVFYQSGFGQAVALRITGPAGAVLFDDALPLGPYVSRTNPDALAALIDLPQAGMTLTVIAPDQDLANQPELDELQLRSGEMYLMARPLGPSSPLAEAAGAVVRQGSAETFGIATVTFQRETRFTVLQVARNPGIPLFVVAAVLLVGGLAVTFYFPHRRLRGIVSALPDGTARFDLAPMARRDWGAQRAFERLVDDLERRLAVPIVRVARGGAGDDGDAVPGSTPTGGDQPMGSPPATP